MNGRLWIDRIFLHFSHEKLQMVFCVDGMVADERGDLDMYDYAASSLFVVLRTGENRFTLLRLLPFPVSFVLLLFLFLICSFSPHISWAGLSS